MLAKQVIMDKQTAQQKEIDDEQNSWVKIINEIEPLPKEENQFRAKTTNCPTDFADFTGTTKEDAGETTS